MEKVILIGGSPMVGKSTIAMLLAGEIKYQCMSTDDVGEVLQTASDINPMRGQNYLDYYANTEKTKLIEDTMKYHKKLEPAISKLIDIHSTWGNPLIIEGWALYPYQYGDKNNVFSVWLIADNDILRERLIMNAAFYANAKDPQKFIENYLYRSEWHTQTILEQCKEGNRRHVLIGNTTTADEVASTILDILKRDR